MIVISTYNPNTPRSTEDEELLTSLLSALILYRNTISNSLLLDKSELQQDYLQAQKKNTDRLIQVTYPLLGLTPGEVIDLIEKRFEK
jgi:hypothetical protein